MRISLNWLREIIEIPSDVTAADIAEILTRRGFEEEEIVEYGQDLVGPIVVGRVEEFVEEPQSNGKVIRWCQVNVGESELRGIVCGARNFEVGDKVVVSLPGAVLPGGFAIAARKTYGHVSDGMICSARELQFSDDHEGIIRLHLLGLDPELGSDAIELLQLRDTMIDVSVLPDRGYAMSMRGIARELHSATGWNWTDPAAIESPLVESELAVRGEIQDPTAARRLVLRTFGNFNPAALSPIWMQRRLTVAGMRPISLAVDVTNYVMLELGQPLHAFDADKLDGHIRVRRAGADVRLTTLDSVERTLDPADIVIADNSGPVALAGTMGGESTEISEGTSRIVLEAASFSFGDVARTSRAHKLSSEASRRFERGVDPELGPVASARAGALLAEYGGAVELGAHQVLGDVAPRSLSMSVNFPRQLVGVDYSADEVIAALESVGCVVEGSEQLQVTLPPWRTDIVGAADLAEEVARVTGYDRIPSIVPTGAVGNGLTAFQQARRNISRHLAESGLVEVLTYPFMGMQDLDALGIESEDTRRTASRLTNPLSAEQPFMRTTLLPTLATAVVRNLGRGINNVAVFEMGMVVLPSVVDGTAPTFGIESRPTDLQISQLDASVPDQPTYVAAIATGDIETGHGFTTSTSSWDWQAVIAAATSVVEQAGRNALVVSASNMPWHPGRCAAIIVDGAVVGYAGELHPRVCEKLSLPARTCAFEINVSHIAGNSKPVVVAEPVRTFPRSSFDLAFVLDNSVTSDALVETVKRSAGELLENVRVFDIYRSEALGLNSRSIAVALTLRSADRTLADTDIAAVRQAVIDAAQDELGAQLR